MIDLDLLDLCQSAYDGPLDFDRDPARGVIRGSTVAFQGSSDPKQWIADACAAAIPTTYCGFVHAGFWETAKLSYPAMLRAKPRALTGHSLGGSLALLTAARLAVDGFAPALVVTFGAPRVSMGRTLGELFADHGVTVRQYRHNNDIVPLEPRLPPWNHPTRNIQIGGPGDGFDSVSDHLMPGYRAALAAYLQTNQVDSPK